MNQAETMVCPVCQQVIEVIDDEDNGDIMGEHTTYPGSGVKCKGSGQPAN